MNFSWTGMEAALSAVVAAALGSSVPVAWSLQAAARARTYPTVVLRRDSMKPQGTGEDWIAAAPADPPPAQDEELVITTVQRYTLALHAFALCDQANNRGNASPEALLSRLLAHMRQEHIDKMLTDAGIGFEGASEIQSDPEIEQPDWRPAAVVELRFDMHETVEAKAGYIAEVVGKIKLGGDPVPFAFPLPTQEEP